MSTTKSLRFFFFSVLLLAWSGHQLASATGFTWIAGDGSWHVPQFWAPFAPPVMGPPGLGDSALIAGNSNITLAANAQGLASMALQAQADVFTNGHQLTVVDIGGTATTSIIGIGLTGNNTELFVEPFGGNTPGFIGDNLDLINGGELDLTAGAMAHITNRLDVDALSVITGDGTIVFTDTHNVNGRRLDLQGSIRPDTNDTITLVAESGTLDLDGFVHNDNLVDLNNTGSGLIVDGPMADSFTGTIEMGENSSFASTLPWELGPTGGAGGESLILVDAGTGDATISGAELTIGGEFARVQVLSGLMRLEADARIQSNAQIFVAGGAELKIGGQTSNSIITGGSWTGSGSVNLDGGLNTIAAATTVNMPNGTFDIDGNTTGDTVAINQTLLLNVASIDDEDFDRIDGTTQINGATGQLHVNFTNPNQQYVFEGILNLNGPGGGLTGVHLAGADVELAGMTTVSGNSTTQARVEVTGDIDIANGASFNLQGGSLDAPNFIRSGASVSGSGTLHVLSGAQLNAEDGVVIDVDVENRGRFAPGVSIASVVMDRQYDQTASATLAMEIAGPPLGNHDLLQVGHAAQIDGALEVSVINGFVPNVGDFYTLLTADSVVGTFATLSLLSDSIFEFEATLIYPGARVVLEFTDVSMLGDFNDDLTLDCSDVDALVAEIASGGMNVDFDLTGEGDVDLHDLDEWLDVAGTFNVGGAYLPGDANLDGFVDGSDFIVWNDNKFTSTAAWCQADFNADGITDGQDFITWNTNKFMSSDHAAIVPEPVSYAMFVLGFGWLVVVRRADIFIV